GWHGSTRVYVGLFTEPAIPRLRSNPRLKVVLPAPSSPHRNTTPPLRAAVPTAAPSASVASSSGSVNIRPALMDSPVRADAAASRWRAIPARRPPLPDRRPCHG